MGGPINSATGALVFSAALVGFAGAASARSDPIIHVGVDPEAEPTGQFSARPNCDAADLEWTTSATTLGPILRLDLESELLGDDFSTRSFDGGVTFSGGTFHIRNELGSATEGFNITAGGSQYLKPAAFATGGNPLVYTFSFNSPIQAFSFYITGVGNYFGGTLDLAFDNGIAQVVPLTNLYQLGGAQFAGFTNAGHSIDSVSLVLANSPNDFNAARMAIDEIRWVGTIPSPGIPVIAALAALTLARRRR